MYILFVVIFIFNKKIKLIFGKINRQILIKDTYKHDTIIFVLHENEDETNKFTLKFHQLKQK